MDFSTTSTSTIDTSPHPSVKKITLLFDNEELSEAMPHQIERFCRVWFTDTKEYAPHLTKLQVVLRPSINSKSELSLNGVHVFLEYFYNYVQYRGIPIEYNIYIDNCASVSRLHRRHFAEEPRLVASNKSAK